MMRYVRAVLVSLLVLAPIALPAADDAFILNYTYYVVAGNVDRVIGDLRAMAKDRGGYVKYFTKDRIILRLPRAEAVTLRAIIGSAGLVSDEQISRKDMGETMVDLRTRLAAKQKLLDDLYRIFDNAELSQTLEVEKAVSGVVGEIESLKGGIAYYHDRILMPEITIYLNASPRGEVTGQPGSSWNWIRSIGVERLINGF